MTVFLAAMSVEAQRVKQPLEHRTHESGETPVWRFAGWTAEWKRLCRLQGGWMLINIADFLDGLEDLVGSETLIRQARLINDSYTTFMYDTQVWDLVKAVLGSRLQPALDQMAETMHGHHFVSELLLRYYSAERVLKYHFVKCHLSQPEEVTVFEMCVDSSRVDIARVNGHSYAYELKTEYDRLDKLMKQLDDYSKAFEYVVALIHPRHLAETVKRAPSYVGVQVYTMENTTPLFEIVREPELSPMLCPDAQVRNLSSKDLAGILKAAGLRAPTRKAERVELVLQEMDPPTVNAHFKLALKTRFSPRWQHVQRFFDRIQPVDLQAFYSSQAEPDWVYYKHSSMV